MNRPICHITHIDNLPSILREGGLICDRRAEENGLVKQGIAHDHIKLRRSKRKILRDPGGNLCDYVPFYFCHHSPMLYAIHRNQVMSYTGGQSSIVYLVSDTDTIVKTNLPYVFTDGHADMKLSRQFSDVVDLNKLDWDIIKATSWSDTDEDGDRTRRKQAEFLVHDFFPWHCVTEIGVYNENIASSVAALIRGNEYLPPVRMRRAWYYG